MDKNNVDVEIYQTTYKRHEIHELEGKILNLGEREWGITSQAEAVYYASSLDTCALVVLFDQQKESKLLGAVHYRTPTESKGAISEIAGRLKDKTRN